MVGGSGTGSGAGGGGCPPAYPAADTYPLLPSYPFVSGQGTEPGARSPVDR